MFVPRVLRLKGVKEAKRSSDEPPSKKARIEEAPEANSDLVTGRLPNRKESTVKPSQSREPRFTTPTISPEYLGQLISGIELVFTDYAHEEKDRAHWLKTHYRDVEGSGKFIHLSAILQHPNISSLKPAATQPLLQRALREQPSSYLELAESGYFVRRRPSTYPLHFIPQNSFDIVDDSGLSFWDQRTIYVEPHRRDLCKTQAKVAHWLKEHGGMRAKWLPVQAIHTLYNSCAFVVLSGNVTHESMWQKWRESERPENWKVLTKVEHTKRTNEYLELLAKEKGKMSHRSHRVPETNKSAGHHPKSIQENTKGVSNMQTPKGRRPLRDHLEGRDGDGIVVQGDYAEAEDHSNVKVQLPDRDQISGVLESDLSEARKTVWQGSKKTFDD